MRILVVILLIMGLDVLTSVPLLAQSAKPNILIILTDDVGLLNPAANRTSPRPVRQDREV